MPIDVDKRFLGLLSLVVAGIFTLQAVNLSVSFSAVEAAHNAQRAAEKARPNPYTSLDAERDQRLHNDVHARENERITAQLLNGDKLTRAELLLIIRTLDIPPKEVKDSLTGLSNRVSRLEQQLNHIELTMEREN